MRFIATHKFRAECENDLKEFWEGVKEVCGANSNRTNFLWVTFVSSAHQPRHDDGQLGDVIPSYNWYIIDEELENIGEGKKQDDPDIVQEGYVAWELPSNDLYSALSDLPQRISDPDEPYIWIRSRVDDFYQDLDVEIETNLSLEGIRKVMSAV